MPGHESEREPAEHEQDRVRDPEPRRQREERRGGRQEPEQYGQVAQASARSPAPSLLPATRPFGALARCDRAAARRGTFPASECVAEASELQAGRAARSCDHPLRRRLRRRHAADRRPLHERDGADGQRPRDVPRLPGRDPRARRARCPASPASRSTSPTTTSSRPATSRTCSSR